MTMKIPVEDGMIIMVKVDPKAIRECYAQSLKVALQLIKAHSNDNVTQIDLTLEFLEECDIIQQCHNIEQVLHTSVEEEMDLDPMLSSKKITLLVMSPWYKFNLVLNIINSQGWVKPSTNY